LGASIVVACKNPATFELFAEEEEIAFLEEVLPWLDSQDYVHRYAYFMASEGSLISGRVLSRVGETFASFV
jgi:hypothetical protein